MANLRSRQAAVQALHDALENVDNAVAANRALRRVGARYSPESDSSWDAFRRAATEAFVPYFDGDMKAAKAVAWATLDGVREGRPVDGDRGGHGRRGGDHRIDASVAHGTGGSPSAPLSELYPALKGEGLEYDLRPYTARNRITLISAPPKRGKSTFATLYARARASGGAFLGQTIEPGTVLYVAPDENWRDVVRRFRSFGTPGERVHVWRDRNRSVARIAHRAEEIGAELVVLDTLLRVAGISDENDNAEWDRWFGEAREHVHDSDAVWLAVHHDRKSGGQDGEGIRGASSIFGSVDVAISLQSTEEGDRRRTLKVEGTRLDGAAPLVIELNASEARYEAVGEANVVSILEDSSLDRLRKVLTAEPATVSSIYDRIREAYPEAEGDVAESTVRSRLGKLTSAGLARRSGEGGRRDPYKYSLNRSAEANRKTERPGKTPEGQGETRSTGGGEKEESPTPDDSRSIAQHPKGAERLSVDEGGTDQEGF